MYMYIYIAGGDNKPTAHAGITSTISGAYHNMLTYTTPDAAAGAGQGGRAELSWCGACTQEDKQMILITLMMQTG